MQEQVKTIELVETPGEFNTKELNLTPGKYQFKVRNENVDHVVGFAIQKKEDVGKDPMQFHVENCFPSQPLNAGEEAHTGVVELAEGEYVYYCPLNPTPHYSITVSNPM